MYFLLFIFWIILNGKITLEVCLLGAGVVTLIALLMGLLFSYDPRRDLRFLKRVPLFLCYLGILFAEILKAGIAVLFIIIDSSRKVEPALLTFRTDLKTETARFILANSITLTPGTITVNLKDGEFTVHCLSREMADGINDSVFVRWLRKMEA